MYVLASSRPWNLRLKEGLERGIGAPVVTISSKEDLSLERLKTLSPRCIFFAHWSWLIPPEIYTSFECIVFHMTDLPFGRGGSPLQNLIERGIHTTKMSALRVTDGIDTGPIYLKRDLRLDGSAEEIFLRAAMVIEEMILEIVRSSPTPVPQSGPIVQFTRRKPEQSLIAECTSLERVYDMIRMLDAEGYPHAFIETEKLRFEFRRASISSDSVQAEVKITLKKSDSSASS